MESRFRWGVNQCWCSRFSNVTTQLRVVQYLHVANLYERIVNDKILMSLDKIDDFWQNGNHLWSDVMKVLIVEDNILLGKSMKRGLEESGYTVDLATNGEDGLYHIEVAHYDLVLLDWMLPQISGLELVKKMRDKGCDAPTIMVTAKGVLSDKIEGYESGADD